MPGISEIVIATCVVSARRILSLFRHIVQRKPLLEAINLFPVIEKYDVFFYIFSILG